MTETGAAAVSPTRDRLLHAIRASPGINKTALCATLGLAWGTVDYHLRRLSRDRQVALRPEGRETRCFPGGLEPHRKALLSALADGSGSRIAFVLRHCPGQGVGALSQQLGLSSKVVRRRLLRMVEDGMLERVGTHRPRYSLGSAVHGLLEEVTAASAKAPGGPLPLAAAVATVADSKTVN